MLEKGDKVVMEKCMEATFHEGVVWNVTHDEFARKGYGQRPVVFLEGFSGSFSTRFLRKVKGDEATVECVTCERKVLHDSNGYYFDGLTGRYSCNKCYEKLLKQQKVQREIEQMRITHTVLKISDIEKSTKKFGSRVKTDLEDIEVIVNHVRKDEGRSQNPRYIVINTDEDPEFIEEIIQVMKRFRKWGV